MLADPYAVYVDTFLQARGALATCDDERLRAICVAVAARDGVDSTMSLLAVSDAEQLHEPRRKSAVMWMLRERIDAGRTIVGRAPSPR